MRNKIISLIFIFIISAQVCFSNEVVQGGVEKVELSFEQAYELMSLNNNMLKSIAEQVKQSKYEKDAAVGEFFPKVGVNSTYIHFANPIDVVSTVPGMGSLSTLVQDENVFTFNGGIVWNIFTGGKIIALNKAARAKLEATNQKYAEVLDSLTVELTKRYFGLRLSRDVVFVKKQYLDGIEKHLKDAKALEREGIIAKSERLHAEVVYADANKEYKAALRNSNIVEESLKTLIKDSNVDLKKVSILPVSMLFLYEDSSIDLEEMKKNALANNPSLKQLRAKRKIADARHKGELANYSPTVSLFAYDVLAASDLSHSVPRWAVGGTVNFTVFDGFSRYNKVRASNAGRKVVDYEIADAEYNIESLVVKQYQELMKYKEQYEASTKSIESATEALRTVTLGFKEGYNSSIDVVDAQLALFKVKIDRLQALYNYDTTFCELLKTNGNTKELLQYISKSKTEGF